MSKTTRSSIAALALVAALGASGAAQAGDRDVDVFWSIGLSQPGVHIGVSNVPARPVLVHEPRYVYTPAPVYVAPRVVHYQPPHPVYRVHPGHHGHGHGHWKHRDDRHGHWDGRHDRHDRHDRHARNDRYERHDGRGHGGHGRGPEMNMGNRR